MAISFATNLFLLAVMLNPNPLPAQQSENPKTARRFGPWLPNAVALGGSLVGFLLQYPVFHTPPWFMPLLLLPHVSLMIPPILHTLIPQSWGYTDDGVGLAQTVYRNLRNVVIWGGGLILLKTTVSALVDVGPGGIARTLYAHPAVSSVGWDVIFCWISWGYWIKICGDQDSGRSNTKEEQYRLSRKVKEL